VVIMEDAAEKLDELARSESECTRCAEIAACRLRALAGAGHPHARVLFVSRSPSPEEEAAGLPAGASAMRFLAGLIPSLNNGGGESSFCTSLLKCVPRSGDALREPRPEEMENCFGYLATEISITTPHYVVPIGRETTDFVLGKLFRDMGDGEHDLLDLRVVDSPAFRVVPVASATELAGRSEKERGDYAKRLRSLASLMGL
jgi:uracil-DNA glycosylase family 4